MRCGFARDMPRPTLPCGRVGSPLPESRVQVTPASVRLPFRAGSQGPLEIRVEYAYCVVDYQCFFGEEVLTVSARYD